jgi:hypothetical protein
MRISIVCGFLFALFAITTASTSAQAMPSIAPAKQIGVQSALESVDYYGYGYNDNCYRQNYGYYRNRYYDRPYRYYQRDRYYGSYYPRRHYYRNRYYSNDYGSYSNDYGYSNGGY